MNIHFISKQNKKYDSFINDTSVEKAVKILTSSKILGFDTETRKRSIDGGAYDALDPYLGEVILIQLGNENDTFVFDCITYGKEELQDVLNILDNEKILKIGHNLKFDCKMIRGTFGSYCSNLYDTSVCDEVIYNGLFNLADEGNDVFGAYIKNFSLAKVYKRYLGIEAEDKAEKKISKSFITQHNKQFTKSQILYAANDTKFVLDIFPRQIARIKKYDLDVVTKLECDLIPAVADMEFNGIKLSIEAQRKIIEKYKNLVNDKEKELNRKLLEYTRIYTNLNKYLYSSTVDLFGQGTSPLKGKKNKSTWKSIPSVLDIFRTVGVGTEEFSKIPGKMKKLSNKNIKQIKLYNEDKLFDPEVTRNLLFDKGGVIPDTKNQTLLNLVKENITKAGTEYIPNKPEYQIVADLLTYREYSKVITTYGTNLLKRIHSKTGRIHPNFNQCFPATGRFSCTNPNLQNIKAEGEFRSIFVAEDGNVLISNDYAGQELVLIAEGSQDEVFLEAFRNKQDVHSRVASILYVVPVAKEDKKKGIEGINEHLRAPAKNLNFGLAYGMGADKLAIKLGIEQSRAAGLMIKYFKAFPKIKEFLNYNAEFAVVNGYSVTFSPFKRIRWYPEYEMAIAEAENGNRKYISRIERQAKNTPIQGSGADMVKLAIVYMYRKLRQGDYKDIKLVLTVHDEIVLEAPVEKEAIAKKLAQESMLDASKVIVKTVPIEVESKSGIHWSK